LVKRELFPQKRRYVMFNLIPWRQKALVRPRAALSLFGDEFDTLFDRFFGLWHSAEEQAGWSLDMKDEGNEFVIRAEAPGFEVEDSDVQVEGDVLTIRAGRKHEEGETKDDNYAYSERRLQRSLTLPADADAAQVQAQYRNGVLELRLPKLPEAQARRI